MSAPLYERLKSYADKNRISFAMPGHKNGRGLCGDLLSLDVTELEETANLHDGGEYVWHAQKLLSGLYGSDKSYILTGGSTAAIQSMICSAVRPGETLLAGSDCHMSVINTCALLSINIKFFPRQIDEEFYIPKGDFDLETYLTEDVAAVIITSPNYYGVCLDVKNIADMCHARNVPLLVDEAHGAHFVSDSRFPETAVHYADAVCQSAHKTLNAMNGAAYLHINGSLIDRNRLEKALSMFQSSSPSYVIAASADLARAEIENGKSWQEIYALCADFRADIQKTGIRVLDNDDITRIVLNFNDFDITGFKVCSLLSDMGIDIEMADLFNVVLIVTASNTAYDLDKLKNALLSVISSSKELVRKISVTAPPTFSGVISPQKAFFAKHREISLKDSQGCTAGVSVMIYPPGIPIIHTGEKIRKEQIEYIEKMSAQGAEVRGITSDGRIAVTDE